jgi:CxxC motif-containing protein (DUF1111 family)
MKAALVVPVSPVFEGSPPMRSASQVRSSVCWLLRGGLAAILCGGAVAAKEPEEIQEAGRALFARAWTPNDPRSRGGDGLGPVFNARSCLDCHDQGGPGGAGRVERNIEIATATGPGAQGYAFFYAIGMDFGAGRFEYTLASNPPAPSRREPPIDLAAATAVHPGFREARSVVLHRFGTDPGYHSWREKAPGLHGTIAVQVSQRNPTPLFGAGLIDAIPDSVIEEAARHKPPGSSRAKGRVSRLKDGRVGRFGWKAQTATLAEFALSAAATEIGLEVPGHHQAGDPRLPGLGAKGLDMDQEECDALVAFVRGLPAPVVREPADEAEAAQVKAGEATFRAIGCASCHLPKLGDVEGIYSDLLLHDMSPRLADTGSYGVFVAEPAGANGPAAAGGPRGESSGATVQEWRTPPLWGLRDSAPYLHDGRAATVAQAIALHGGQGAASSQRFAQLSTRRKQQLETFLLSLSAPPRGDEAP